MCQYGIFCKIRNDKKAIERRKVARVSNIDIVEELNKAEKSKYTIDNPASLMDFLEDDPAVCQV